MLPSTANEKELPIAFELPVTGLPCAWFFDWAMLIRVTSAKASKARLPSALRVLFKTVIETFKLIR